MSHKPAPHLCGPSRLLLGCPYLVFTGREPGQLTGRTLKPFSVYCTRGGKFKKLGNKATWTGLTPKSCPRRQQWEKEHGDGN